MDLVLAGHRHDEERIVKVPELSHGKRRTGNLIIHGENMVALHWLCEKFLGKIRCIYIDPPYNNKETYTHYDDDLAHEVWLDRITSRLPLLLSLLGENGSLWISIDDREMHYLKVAADKFIGRERYVTTIIWEQRTTRENRKVFSNNHEYLLVYAKNPKVFAKTRNAFGFTAEALSRYSNPDHDPRGIWQSVSANVQAGHGTKGQFYELVSPGGARHNPPKGRCWIYGHERMLEEIRKGNIWFGKSGNGVPRLKVFLKSGSGLTPDTLWKASEVGTTRSAKRHLLEVLPMGAVFDTPKPEELVYRIVSIATDPGDYVLDCYLGSGTTAAVAHKMGRRYIGIERGEHVITHGLQRLRRVVEGERGGVSGLVGWSGGGGFDFLKLDHDAADGDLPRDLGA